MAPTDEQVEYAAINVYYAYECLGSQGADWDEEDEPLKDRYRAIALERLLCRDVPRGWMRTAS